MTLPRDKESVLAELPTGLKPGFLYLADQIEALSTATNCEDVAPNITLQWPTRIPLPGYLIAALANFAGEAIEIRLVP